MALSLGSPPPDVIRRRVRPEPGLSSPPRRAAVARPTGLRPLGKPGLWVKGRALWRGSLGCRTIVPADWLTRSVTPIVSADAVRRYGYQWFVLDVAFGQPRGWAVGRLERMWMAQGEGGQRLFVIPSLRLVIALTAGNYGQPDQWKPPTHVLRDVVLACLT